MFDLRLSEEQLEIRDTVREFVTNEVRPVAIKPERMEALDRSPMWPQLEAASQLGLRTLTLSEELGGAGADALTAVIVAEELAVGDPDLATTLIETSAVARHAFGPLASDAQRAKFLEAFTGDDRFHIAYAASRADTDIGVNYHLPFESGRITATATKAGDDWILNGESHCVTNAPIAKMIVVSARPDGGVTPITLLVPRETPRSSTRACACPAPTSSLARQTAH
jgi:alkylation response protein AidB-like acyl-CoA dehydrogenase